MSYATIDDIFSRYPPISTMVGTGSNDVTSVQISSVYIADAESVMNAFLANRYIVPVQVEPIITMIASDLAISNMLFERLGEIPDFIQPRYDRANSLLDKLSDGKLVLTASGNTNTNSGDNFAWSSTQDYHPIFSPVLDALDQAVDQDYVRAEINAREGELGVSSGC